MTTSKPIINLKKTNYRDVRDAQTDVLYGIP